jgi:predicted anti-sigma-YlaC factor YlaD
VSCEAGAAELPRVVDGARRPSASMAEHLQTCLVCQAEVAGYRRLLRVLRSMRESQVPLPSAELVGSALSMLHQHPLWGRRRSLTPWLIVGALGVGAFGPALAVQRRNLTADRVRALRCYPRPVRVRARAQAA